MRIFGPMWSDNGYLLSPDGKAGAVNYARNHANYDKSLDFLRAFGRGIATVSGATDFQQHGMWVVNGVEDTQDLRHNHEVGNWVRMEDLKYNNPESEYYGKNLQLYDDQGKNTLYKLDSLTGLISRITKSSWMTQQLKPIRELINLMVPLPEECKLVSLPFGRNLPAACRG